MSTLQTYHETENTPAAGSPATDASDDGQVLTMWLHGKSEATREYYEQTAANLLELTDKPLRQIRLEDLHDWINTLKDYAPSTQATKVSAIKSLFSFAHKIGYVQYNVGAVIDTPKFKDTLAERILPETTVQKIIGMEPSDRNTVPMRFLYLTGARVSEVRDLTWEDVTARDTGGQVTLFGKGSKTRRMRIKNEEFWSDLVSLRNSTDEEDPVFSSREGGQLTKRMIQHIVRKAAERAGVDEGIAALVSPRICLPRARSRSSGPYREGYPRARQSANDEPVCPRPA